MPPGAAVDPPPVSTLAPTAGRGDDDAADPRDDRRRPPDAPLQRHGGPGLDPLEPAAGRSGARVAGGARRHRPTRRAPASFHADGRGLLTVTPVARRRRRARCHFDVAFDDDDPPRSDPSPAERPAARPADRHPDPAGRLPAAGLGVAACSTAAAAARPVRVARSSRRCRATSRSSTTGWSNAASIGTTTWSRCSSPASASSAAFARPAAPGPRAGQRRRHPHRRLVPAAHWVRLRRRSGSSSCGTRPARSRPSATAASASPTDADRFARVHKDYTAAIVSSDSRRAVLRRGVRHPGGPGHPDRHPADGPVLRRATAQAAGLAAAHAAFPETTGG